MLGIVLRLYTTVSKPSFSFWYIYKKTYYKNMLINTHLSFWSPVTIIKLTKQAHTPWFSPQSQAWFQPLKTNILPKLLLITNLLYSCRSLLIDTQKSIQVYGFIFTVCNELYFSLTSTLPKQSVRFNPTHVDASRFERLAISGKVVFLEVSKHHKLNQKPAQNNRISNSELFTKAGLLTVANFNFIYKGRQLRNRQVQGNNVYLL